MSRLYMTIAKYMQSDCTILDFMSGIKMIVDCRHLINGATEIAYSFFFKVQNPRRNDNLLARFAYKGREDIATPISQT